MEEALDILARFAMSPPVKSIIGRGIFIMMALALGACASSNLQAKTAPAGTRFTRDGRITLHRGEPCTPQIMFDFHPIDSKAVVWLAAGARDSRKLTEAAKDRRQVRITGVWRQGRHSGCGYVDVKKLTVERSWWGKLWKP